MRKKNMLIKTIRLLGLSLAFCNQLLSIDPVEYYRTVDYNTFKPEDVGYHLKFGLSSSDPVAKQHAVDYITENPTAINAETVPHLIQEFYTSKQSTRTMVLKYLLQNSGITYDNFTNYIKEVVPRLNKDDFKSLASWLSGLPEQFTIQLRLDDLINLLGNISKEAFFKTLAAHQNFKNKAFFSHIAIKLGSELNFSDLSPAEQDLLLAATLEQPKTTLQTIAGAKERMITSTTEKVKTTADTLMQQISSASEYNPREIREKIAELIAAMHTWVAAIGEEKPSNTDSITLTLNAVLNATEQLADPESVATLLSSIVTIARTLPEPSNIIDRATKRMATIDAYALERMEAEAKPQEKAQIFPLRRLNETLRTLSLKFKNKWWAWILSNIVYNFLDWINGDTNNKAGLGTTLNSLIRDLQKYGDTLNKEEKKELKVYIGALRPSFGKTMGITSLLRSITKLENIVKSWGDLSGPDVTLETRKGENLPVLPLPQKPDAIANVPVQPLSRPPSTHSSPLSSPRPTTSAQSRKP